MFPAGLGEMRFSAAASADPFCHFLHEIAGFEALVPNQIVRNHRDQRDLVLQDRADHAHAAIE